MVIFYLTIEKPYKNLTTYKKPFPEFPSMFFMDNPLWDVPNRKDKRQAAKAPG